MILAIYPEGQEEREGQARSQESDYSCTLPQALHPASRAKFLRAVLPPAHGHAQHQTPSPAAGSAGKSELYEPLPPGSLNDLCKGWLERRQRSLPFDSLLRRLDHTTLQWKASARHLPNLAGATRRLEQHPSGVGAPTLTPPS